MPEKAPNTNLSLALEGPNIDWGFQGSDAISGQTQIENWYLDTAWHPPSARDFQVFGGQDLRMFSNGTRTVVFVVNAGTINHLFYNPHHRQQVRGSPPVLLLLVMKPDASMQA